jgi:hypothetical protein
VPEPPEPVLHFWYCGADGFLCAPLVSIRFGHSVTNIKAGRPFNRLAHGEDDERSYRSAFQPYIGNPAFFLRLINVDEEILIKNSALQLYSVMQKRLLKRLQRVWGISHSCGDLPSIYTTEELQGRIACMTYSTGRRFRRSIIPSIVCWVFPIEIVDMLANEASVWASW